MVESKVFYSIPEYNIYENKSKQINLVGIVHNIKNKLYIGQKNLFYIDITATPKCIFFICIVVLKINLILRIT